MAESVKQKNRTMRQDNLREALVAGGHIQHVVDISEKLRNLENTLESADIQRLTASANIKLKLIDKYLPSLKQSEISGTVNHAHTHEGLQDANSRIADLLEQGTTPTDTAPKPH